MQEKIDITKWLPITWKEVQLRAWDEVDVVIVSGDAYVDHPSYGAAVIGRIIEAEGFKVAIVPQPNWQDDWRDFKKMGKPRLFFGVTSGNMDSMINHYTASKRKRSTDGYTPGGQAGFRPDYATTVYTKILKELYPDTPVVIGGIEASLRRVTHYDYWSNQLKPTILKESGADLLLYGMAEQALRELLRLLDKGVPFSSIKSVQQTAFLSPTENGVPKDKRWKVITLSSHETCLTDKRAFAANFKPIEQEANRSYASRIIQEVGKETLVINPPFPVMNEKTMDASFDLPYTRLPHPKYNKRGTIPAFEMIKFSINMHRGCFGGCSFCTISAHQGKFIASRSQESILKEVDALTKMPDFKGYISDLGGPSANMYKLQGKNMDICDRCVAPSCIHPVVCDNLDTDHSQMTEIYKKAAAHPKVKKAFIGSGIRYDLLTKSYNKKGNDSLDEYLEQVVCHNISGRLKVAPEHTSDETLKIMRKPSFKHFHSFKEKYEALNKKHGLNQPLIPYFISSHPGSTEEEMANLAAETKAMGFRLEQVQDFTPTPMTVATIIYYTGLHPYTLRPHFTAKTKVEKKNQHLFFFWHKKENHGQILTKLKNMGRTDLIEKLLERAKKNSDSTHPNRPQKNRKKIKFGSKKGSKPFQKPNRAGGKKRKFT